MTSDSLNLFFKILTVLEGKLEKDALKEDLATSLAKPIKNMRRATDEMIYALYLIGGANSMGLFFEPIDPEKSATEIVSQFFKSYQKFINSSQDLAKYLKLHLAEIKLILSPQECLILEVFINSFEGEKFDINFLYGHGLFQEIVIDEYEREKKFPMLLNSKMNEEIAKSPSLSSLMGMMNFTNNDVMKLIAQLASEMALTKMVDENEED
jgi:hypothetical protein